MKCQPAIILLVASLSAICACSKNSAPEEGNVTIEVSIPAKYPVLPGTFTLYNDVDNSYTTVSYDASVSVKVPVGTKKIYAVMPSSSSYSGPSSVQCTLSSTPTMDADGKMSTYDCYLYATGSVSGKSAVLSFKPVASTLVFSISKSGNVPETVQTLTFAPDNVTNLVGKQKLDLTAGNVRFTTGDYSSKVKLTMNNKPSVAGATADAMVFVPYKAYESVEVTVATTRGEYTFNCGSIDMCNTSEKTIALNLDNADKFVPVEELLTENIIPDFSNVGYRYGDSQIPDVPVIATLTPPSDGSDAKQLIQNAIDNATTPGAILLKSGKYNVDGTIVINKSGIVLRGEGQDAETGTVIYSTSVINEGEELDLIRIGSNGGSANLVYHDESKVRIDESFVPCGRKSFLVEDASGFSAGDKIAIYRPGTQAWIHDLLMDQIPDSGDTQQWQPGTYNLHWERNITRIEGKRIHIDTPVVMALETKYGGGYITHVTSTRIEECGIENLRIDSRFDDTKKDTHDGIPVFVDESHCWWGITVAYAEHCWIRNVTAIHMAGSAVKLDTGSKNITVDSCTSLEPVSVITGSRRYAFNFAQPQLSLCINCTCDLDRHQFVTGARACGPNAFVECKSTNSFSDAGPHHRWATGVLWDCVEVDRDLRIRDRGNSGTGHGWAGANCVLWNCLSGSTMQCDSPQVSAKNYAVGCISSDRELGRSMNGKDRPVGEWASYNTNVLSGEYYGAVSTQKSLYRSQLARKLK